MTSSKFGKPSADNSITTKDALKQVEKMGRIKITDLVTPPRIVASTLNPESVIPHVYRGVQQHAENIDDSVNIYKILPDLAIASDTLTNNILSPVDLQKGDLNIGIHKEAPPECAELIRDHFSSDAGYNFNKLLPTFINEGLITIGSVPLLPIPPSAIRGLIRNNTYGLESLGTTLNIMSGKDLKLPLIGNLKNNQSSDKGDKVYSHALESAIDDTLEALMNGLDPSQPAKKVKAAKEATEEISGILTGIKPNVVGNLVEVSDNPAYLIHGPVLSGVNEYNEKTITSLGWGLESVNVSTKPMAEYRDRSVKLKPHLDFIFTREEGATQDPIVLHLPSESVLPITDPATGKHVAYYIAIDPNTGNPLRLRNHSNRFKILNDTLDRTVKNQATTVNYRFGAGYNNASNMAINGQSNSAILFAAYEEQFEKELTDIVSKSKNEVEVTIAKSEHWFRMVYTRQMCKMGTRVVYVPADRLCYMAYNYDPDGVGESLIQKTKLQSSFRSILTVAQNLAAVKSSTNRSKVTINIDDNEIDPRGTVEMVRNEMAGLMSDGFPINAFQVTDIVDSLQKAGMQTVVTGSSYPNTTVDLVESKREVSPPDMELQNMLKEQQYQGFGLSLDLLEQANKLEFMGQLDNINLLQSKRMIGKQVITCENGAKFIKTYLRCGGDLYNRLQNVLTQNRCSLTMEMLIESITMILPTANYAQHKAQAAAYADYVLFVTDVLDAVMSDTEMGGLLKGDNIPNQIAGAKLIILNELKRRYLKTRNILPEVFELIADKDKTLKDILEGHIQTNVSLVTELATYIATTEHKADENIQKVEDKLNPPEAPEEVTNVEESSDSVGEEEVGEPEETSAEDESTFDNPDDNVESEDDDQPEDDNKDPDKTQDKP